jgi:hypothetical protein
MIVQAGPPLSSFLVFDEITGFHIIVPDDILLLLALLGLLAALFLQPPRS